MFYDRSKEMDELDKIFKQARGELPDSGERRQFETGAVRDIAEGKGRCDLLPLKEIGYFIYSHANDDKTRTVAHIIKSINLYIRKGLDEDIYSAISQFMDIADYDHSMYTAFLELSKHYEAGAKKYDERNWEKGIPCHCYIDSGVRHLLKWLRGDIDEPHDRAFLWNMFGLLWTMHNIPTMNDLPCAGYKVSNKTELTEKDLENIKLLNIFEKEKK